MRFLTISGHGVVTDNECCPHGHVRLEAREARRRAVCVTMRHASDASASDGTRARPPWRTPWRVAGAIASAAGALSPAGPPGSGPALHPLAAACAPRVSATP
jgi:hypothetical protein